MKHLALINTRPNGINEQINLMHKLGHKVIYDGAVMQSVLIEFTMNVYNEDHTEMYGYVMDNDVFDSIRNLFGIEQIHDTKTFILDSDDGAHRNNMETKFVEKLFLLYFRKLLQNFTASEEAAREIYKRNFQLFNDNLHDGLLEIKMASLVRDTPKEEDAQDTILKQAKQQFVINRTKGIQKTMVDIIINNVEELIKERLDVINGMPPAMEDISNPYVSFFKEINELYEIKGVLKQWQNSLD